METYTWSTAYVDLLKEINILEMRLRDLKTDLIGAERAYQRSFVKMTASYSGMPSGSGTNIQAMDYAEMLQNEIIMIEHTLERKNETKREMEQEMGDMQSLERRIAFKRDVEQKSLQQIALDLNFSYSWVSKISARTERLKVS
ncbi:hypothetical protein B1748_23570 [Paenibacillus sp. MY03]|uniref:hypothetical protein n=1 Tax=Paenibacillus sp. MY03 TaxID=302980 RepID=UPI000B3C0B53|nr:hypothetical protein [Paenibacillus sp. MY03]OUS72991.1 hypothetical protein B1748_23570 [Paenibacillus sp. MY03]